MSVMRLVKNVSPWLLVAAIVAVAWTTVQGAGKKEKPQKPPQAPSASPVITAPVVGGAASRAVRLPGTVVAPQFVVIAGEVGGPVDAVAVEAGDAVEAGQTLASIRKRPLELERDRAEAEVQAAQARLAELRAGTRREDMDIARADHQRAVALAELAETNLQRVGKLLKAQAVSTADLDRATEAMTSAKADVAVTRARLARAKAGPRVQEIRAAEAAVERAEAARDLAADQLARAELKAPFAGVITARHTEVGAWLRPGDRAFELQRTDTVRVRVQVPERFYSDFAVGASVEVTVDGAGGTVMEATVSRRVPRAANASRSFPVEIDLENGDRRLAPGMLARVTFGGAKKDAESVLVPRDALVPRGPKSAVFKIQRKDGVETAHEVSVEIGRYFGDAVEVFGDLKAGDRVVVRGNERLREGQPVRPSRLGAAAES